MITFILQDIITAAMLSFTAGLYLGAFIQRRRDNVRFYLTQKMIKLLLNDKNIKRVEKQNG